MHLTLQHPRRTFIKFLRLPVPHVLRCDADPMAEDFIGIRARIFPLVTLALSMIQILPKHLVHLTLAFLHWTCAFTHFTCALTNIKSQSKESSFLHVSLYFLNLFIYFPSNFLYSEPFFSPRPFYFFLIFLESSTLLQIWVCSLIW